MQRASIIPTEIGLARARLSRAQKGFYHGKGKLHGNNVAFSVKKTKRNWKPNVQWVTLRSELLHKAFQVRVTCHALRCIKKAGGVDDYILWTDPKNIDSTIAMELKEHLVPLWEKKTGQKYQRSRVLFTARQEKVQAVETERAEMMEAFNRRIAAWQQSNKTLAAE